jgi:hypothetical protein
MGPRLRTAARWNVLASLLGMLALVAVGRLVQQKSGLNPDVAWFLELALRLIHGHTLYLDAPGSALEVNPPLAIWTLVPAIQVASRLGVNIADAPTILVGIEAIVALAMCVFIARRAPRSVRSSVWFIAVAGVCLPAHDFAQREHQLVLLLSPYILWLAIAQDGKHMPLALRIAIAAWAGVGVSLKPHFVGAWALCELSVALLDRAPRRLMRAEVLTVAAVITLYGLALLAITPEYLRVVESVGPLYLRMHIRPPTDVLLRPESLASMAALVLAWNSRHRGAAGRIALTFAIAATAFVIAVVVQGKGFDYHYYPVFAFAVVSGLTTLYASDRTTGGVARTIPAYALAGALLLLALLRIAVGVVLGEENRRLTAAYGYMARVRASHGAGGGGNLVVLTTRVQHAFPMATYLGLGWPLRVPALAALETITPHGCTAASTRDQGIERRITDGLFADLTRAMPTVVIVAPLPAGMLPRSGCMTVTDHLSREPRFAGLFAGYTPIDTIPRKVYGPFVVLARRSAAVPRPQRAAAIAGHIVR